MQSGRRWISWREESAGRHQIGLDYVSCSPYRLPIARLAAAQAALREPEAADRCAHGKPPRADRRGAGGKPVQATVTP